MVALQRRGGTARGIAVVTETSPDLPTCAATATPMMEPVTTDATTPDDVIRPLLTPQGVDRLRAALSRFTVDEVDDLLGLAGRAAMSRGDRAAVRRIARAAGGPTAALCRLFLLGDAVAEQEAAAALRPLDLDDAAAAGLVRRAGDTVRALVDIRPYAEAAAEPSMSGHAVSPGAAPPWWVVSDFGSDVRPGALERDHVLGVGAAALTLAQATVRRPVGRALDIGTGCGVQALHASRHAAEVVATDVSPRALRFAATTAALSGVSWDLRRGSLLDPVQGESFDLVVANPPFVVSPGSGAGIGFDYRDSGFAGDEVCRTLVSELPSVLAPGGIAQLLANWVIPVGGDWRERMQDWFAGSGCDAWVWQREVADPAEYVALWLRDAGADPTSDSYQRQYDGWLDWFAAHGVAGVGMGLITLWRSDTATPVVVCEDVPQPLEQPIWPHIALWHERQRRLATADDEQLLGARLRHVDDLVRTRHELITPEGWAPAQATLRQSHGMRWELEVDDGIAAVVAGCDGAMPLYVQLAVLASASGVALDALAAAALPAIRDLIARGFLEPVDGSA